MVQIVCLVLLAGLLLWAAASDVRRRIIPNRLNLAVALLAPAWWWACGLSLWPGVAEQVALGAAVFALFALLFAWGMIGGGDVKLLGALGLWLPTWDMLGMLVWMGLYGGGLSLVLLVRHRLRAGSPVPEVPYGLAIVAATLPIIANRILTMPAA